MLEYAMRGISVMLTALYLLTAASACRIEEERVFAPAEGIPVTEKEERRLAILACLPEAGLALQQVAEIFAGGREDAPRVTVQTVADPADYRSALRLRLVAGERTDLFQLNGTEDLAALEPYLEDLGSLGWAEGAAAEPLRIGSRLAGIPYAVRGGGFLVNSEIFEAAGLPLLEITDYGSWRESFLALEEKIEAGELAEAYPELAAVTTLPAQSGEYLGRYAADLFLSGAFPSRAEALEAQALPLPDMAGCGAFLETMIACSPYRQSWSGLVAVTPGQMLENGLAAGRLAAVLADTDLWRRIQNRNPELELSLLPVFLDSWEEGAVFVDAPAYWAVNFTAEAEAKALAGEFLAWLYREEGSAFLAGSLGAASPYRDAAVDTGIVLHRQLYAAIDGGLARPSLAAAAPWGWGEELFAPQIREYLTQYDKTWEEVAAACQEGWKDRRNS